MSETVGTVLETRSELVASRARIQAEADESRRRWQSEIHDGAQQRLTHAVIVLTMARDALEAGSPDAGLVDEALTNLRRASSDLREAVRRLLPRSLASGGLRPGLASLLDDVGVPADLRVDAPRLSTSVETTAYAVVADALEALLARAGSTRLAVGIELAGRDLVVSIRRDGAGVEEAGETDLVRVRDRVAVAGGTLTTTRAAGTSVVTVVLPTGRGADPA